MVINIANHEATVIERGVYYFALAEYPHITANELKRVVAFIKYEEAHDRKAEITCAEENILAIISNAVAHPDFAESVLLPAENKFVYHATDIKAARSILSGGKLLSAANVYGKSGEELSHEKRDSPWNDPADYFEYIMFCWGDNMTGDYVVLSDCFPNDKDLTTGNFNPGVRFYFRYDDITKHPKRVFDGYHPVKVKDEIILSDYLHSCIVPEQFKHEINHSILPELISKVYFMSQKGISLNDWNSKVYDFVGKL